MSILFIFSSSVQDMAEGSGCSGYISPESSPSENLQSHQEQTNGLLQQHKLEPLKQRTSGSLQQQLTNSSSPSSVEQDVSASCSNPKTATNSSRSSFSHSKKDVDRTETVPVCRLCDNLVTIKMEPCGHAVVCHVCARRARKCLQCRVSNTVPILFIGRAKRAPHWGVQSRFRVIYVGMSYVCCMSN